MSKVQISPTPAHSFVSIETDLVDEGILKIFDGYGKLMNQLSIPSGKNVDEIEVFDWVNGMYYFELIVAEESIESGKFMVIN